MNGLFRRLRMDYKNQGFPFITAGVLLAGLSVYKAGKPSSEEEGKTSSFVKRLSQKLINTLKHDNMPVLPKQEKEKPVLMFDLENILIKHRFFPLQLYFPVYKRQFSGVFLFHLAHLYEIVSTTDSTDHEKIFRQVDPYGCITYRLFLPDKKLFEPKHLNRPLEKVICLASEDNEYNKRFQKNVLNIGRWEGKKDHKLLGLLDFLVNLYFTNTKDWRKTIYSYKEKAFFPTFEKVHRQIFSMKHFLSRNLDKKHKETVDRINRERVCEYESAKVIMDENIERDKLAGEGVSIYQKAARVLKELIF